MAEGLAEKGVMEELEKTGQEISMSDKELLQDSCQTEAMITQEVIDPQLCFVTGEGTKTAEIHQTTEVFLFLRLSNYNFMRGRPEIVSMLKSLYNGSVMKCNVDQSGPGEYRIQYTPTVRGRHELTVSVDGKQVTGNPFPVFVSISPKLFNKPIKVWNDIQCPSGITANFENKIIITKNEGDIIELDTHKNKTRLVQSFLTDIDGITTDREGNIYCMDESNTIMKCDKDGDHIRVYEAKQTGHHGISVMGNEVMLCACNNKGTIMIYDRELKYKRHIQSRDMAVFTDVSADTHGNIYVGDCYNDCIQVFSNSGVFSHSIGFDSRYTKRLDAPSCVCVFGQYVYFTDIASDYVSVFTTTGVHVTSFGQLGVEEGSFFNPSGVCVDYDGFVYVADYGNNRVQMF